MSPLIHSVLFIYREFSAVSVLNIVWWERHLWRSFSQQVFWKWPHERQETALRFFTSSQCFSFISLFHVCLSQTVCWMLLRHYRGSPKFNRYISPSVCVCLCVCFFLSLSPFCPLCPCLSRLLDTDETGACPHTAARAESAVWEVKSREASERIRGDNGNMKSHLRVLNHPDLWSSPLRLPFSIFRNTGKKTH